MNSAKMTTPNDLRSRLTQIGLRATAAGSEENQVNEEKQQYVQSVLQLYLDLPHTPARFSRLDRRLAEQLWARGVRFQAVEMAMLLATGRRLTRSPQAPPLGPIRSMHYFLPVIEEITKQPLPESYLHYLRHKVAQLKPKRQPANRA